MRHASDSGPGRYLESLALHEGIYGSGYHFPDDTRSNRHQFRHLCRNQNRRNSRRRSGHLRLYSSILHYRHDHCKTLLKISEYGSTPKRSFHAETCSCRFDCLGRNLDSDFRFLAGRIDPLWLYQLDSGRAFLLLFSLTSEMEGKSDPCHGNFPAFSMQVFLCLSNKTNGRSVFDLPFYHSFLNFNQQSFFPSLNAFPTASPSAV